MSWELGVVSEIQGTTNNTKRHEKKEGDLMIECRITGEGPLKNVGWYERRRDKSLLYRWILTYKGLSFEFECRSAGKNRRIRSY
jgi:hypothetical protein